MENYSTLETLYQNYRNRQDNKDNKDNKDLQVLKKEFTEILKKHEEDPSITSELLALLHSINFISSKLAFEDGFKCGILLAKECGLL